MIRLRLDDILDSPQKVGRGGKDEMMRFRNPLLVVTDMNRTLEFYQKVLGLDVVVVFGAN